MTPRHQELLTRYPDDLTDAELDELRAAAEADDALDAAMDAALLLDAEGEGTPVPDFSGPLSPRNQRRVDLLVRQARAWSAGPAAPLEASADEDEAPTAWSAGPAAPLEAHAEQEAPRAWTAGPAAPLEAKADNVVPLFRRPAFQAVAALLLVAVALALRFGDDGYQGGLKGDATEVEGQLVLMGDTRLDDGDERPADRPVQITARLEDSASIALIEVQGETSAVVWPLPERAWLADVGPNLLAPPGASADYRPARAGSATYVLVGRGRALGEDGTPGALEPLAIARRAPVTVEELLAANPGAAELDRITIVWTEPEGGTP